LSIEFHKIWIDQCEATEGIRDHFGPNNALDYLIGEKLLSFVHAAEQHPEFATELPAFVAAIRHLFTAEQICDYLDRLEQRKYLAPRKPDQSLMISPRRTKTTGSTILSWVLKSCYVSFAFATCW
jgi:hypothetical protein